MCCLALAVNGHEGGMKAAAEPDGGGKVGAAPRGCVVLDKERRAKG